MANPFFETTADHKYTIFLTTYLQWEWQKKVKQQTLHFKRKLHKVGYYLVFVVKTRKYDKN